MGVVYLYIHRMSEPNLSGIAVSIMRRSYIAVCVDARHFYL